MELGARLRRPLGGAWLRSHVRLAGVNFLHGTPCGSDAGGVVTGQNSSGAAYSGCFCVVGTKTQRGCAASGGSLPASFTRIQSEASVLDAAGMGSRATAFAGALAQLLRKASSGRRTFARIDTLIQPRHSTDDAHHQGCYDARGRDGVHGGRGAAAASSAVESGSRQLLGGPSCSGVGEQR